MSDSGQGYHQEWENRYAEGVTPWDSGEPSRELVRLLDEWPVTPSRALEIGCGTGTNAIFLAQRGFNVTACDISQLALDRAREKAAAANVSVDFRHVDLAVPTNSSSLRDEEPYPFVFDRGVYHTVREIDLSTFLQHLAHLVAPGGWYFVLAGNADETKAEGGPPTVTAATMLSELEPLFELHQLRRFRFHGVEFQGEKMEPLAWSAVLRRR